MVEGFYERGAEKVYALEPAVIGNRVLVSQFAIKLPGNPDQRIRCLKWAAKYEGEGSPSPDTSQKYLLVVTD